MNALWVCTAGKLLQTTAAQAWEHLIATCLTSKNPGLVLQFLVLVQVPKKGLHSLLERANGQGKAVDKDKKVSNMLLLSRAEYMLTALK